MDLKQEYDEFLALKANYAQRNYGYWVARQAFRGRYLWPADWPQHKMKLPFPMVRKAVLVNANFLMGRGFRTQVQPLGTGKSHRTAAEKAEKALFNVIDACHGWRSFWRGALHGSLLGTTVFKVFKDESDPSNPKACFTAAQPEYCYPITRGDDYSQVVKVHYAYSIDRIEAARLYGGSPDDYKSELEVAASMRGEPVSRVTLAPVLQQRRVPVLEVWTDDEYALIVGGKPLYNGKNPYGFIPYVVIPNIDSTDSLEGLSDVDQLLPINQALNVLFSNVYYAVNRWANPTLWWQSPPADFHERVAGILGGGGALPLKTGAQIGFLAWPGQPPDVAMLLDRLREIGIEVAGLNEEAWSGATQGAINTGPSLELKFQNVLATLNAKQQSWQVGLRKLMGMLLALAADSKDLGYADNPSATGGDSRRVRLTGDDIGEHRDVKIIWPGALPKDDLLAARFELEKLAAGAQSITTTLENLGFDWPSDELARIEEEMKREGVRPDEQATLMRAQATALTAEAQAKQLARQAAPEGLAPEDLPPPESSPSGQPDLAARLEEIRRREIPQFEFPLVGAEDAELVEPEGLNAT